MKFTLTYFGISVTINLLFLTITIINNYQSSILANNFQRATSNIKDTDSFRQDFYHVSFCVDREKQKLQINFVQNSAFRFRSPIINIWCWV